jgi:hypothetical protein
MNESMDLELLRDEIECLKGLYYFLQEELINLRELFNGSIRSTVKVSQALRDGLLEMENRIADIELKKAAFKPPS